MMKQVRAESGRMQISPRRLELRIAAAHLLSNSTRISTTIRREPLNHHQPMPYPDGNRLGSALSAQFCQNLTHVELRGMFGDLQLRCDRFVGGALREHA